MEELDYHPDQQTETAQIWIENGIMHIRYLKNSEITIEVKMDHYRSYKSLSRFGKLPVLLELEEGVTITKEAKEFSRRIEDKQLFTACAVVADSLAYRLLANFYARFYQPKKPFRVFTKKEMAIKWLEEFKSDPN